MNSYVREPINTYTHLLGAILSIFALIAMLLKVSGSNYTILAITSVAIFGSSMILLYSASAIYHMAISSDKTLKFLRRLDHSMIFVLIAGTYTPFCLIALNGPKGWVLFISVCTIAILGILFKMCWFRCPRWLSTGIYIAMGWLAIFLAPSLYKALSPGGLFLLVLGGILYTIGGVIYGLKPKFSKLKVLGHHEIFHIFILLGTLAHYLSVYFYVI